MSYIEVDSISGRNSSITPASCSALLANLPVLAFAGGNVRERNSTTQPDIPNQNVMNTSLFRTLTLWLFVVMAGAITPLFAQTFVSQDVGTPAVAGSSTVNGDSTVTLTGGGDDIWNNSDNFHYYYTSVTGLVWEAKMRIISFEGPDQWSKVNLMVRRPSSVGAPPAGDDPHYSATSTRMTGQNEIRPNWRGTRAGGSGDATPSPAVRPTYPNQWLRVTRTNTFFTLSYSTNGVNWTQLHTQNTATTANGFDGTAWEDPILVGVAVTAHNNTAPNIATAVVSNLTVTVHPVTPPTSAGIVSQISGTANAYAHSEASFNFVATNNANPPILYGMTYEWYKNGVRVATNSMGPNYTFLTVPADNGATIQAIARVNDPAYSSISVTSAVAVLTVNPTVVVYTNGLKREFFTNGPTRVQVEIGSVPPAANITLVAQAQLAGGFGDNYAQRFSGYFIPPTTDYYVFFVASDDDCDVFLSTDANPANKQLVAQEGDWSGNLSWHTPGGGGSVASQKRSDQWSPDGGSTFPHSAGIPLTAGNRYYFESVMRQGGGGDNWAVTYYTTNEVADPNFFVNVPNGTPSKMTAANQNIALITPAPTTLTWSVTPTNLTVFEGNNATFYSRAQTDSELLPLYTWYVNGVAQATNTNPNVTLPVVGMPLNGAQISVVARTAVGGLSITSGPVTLTVQQAVWEPGYVRVERWNGATRQQVNQGTVGTPNFTISVPGFVMGLDNPGAEGNFARRFTGFFVPPTTGSYVFFVNGDDDTDLFISTDATPANKRLVCQEAGWSGPLTWVGAGGGGSTAAQKRSDQWSPDGGLTVPHAAGINLTAGQRYYVEMAFRQGGGGANVQATYKLTTEPDPVNGSNARMVNTTVGMNAVRCSFVAFTEQPAGVAAIPFQYATFSARGTTDSQLAVGSFLGNEGIHSTNFMIYQWQKNGVDIPGATARTLTYGPVLPSDNGAQFTCRIRALGYADNALNRLWSNSVPATLTVSGQAVLETGAARVEWWSNSTRVAILNGTAGNPHRIYTTPKMIAPSGSPMDNYANRVSGFFIPPTTGDYVFFLNSDDDSDLFLSTDETPANKRLIARAVGWSGSTLGWNETGGGGNTLAQRRSDQFTDPNTGTQPYTAGIPLTAGQRYYIEGVHTEGSGGDYFAATYKLINDPDPVNGEDTKISSSALAFYAPRIPWVAFTQHPQGQAVVSGANSVTFSAAGTNAPSIVVGNTGSPVPWFNNPTYLQYQWYKNGTPIPGANASTYTLFPVLPSDHNAQFVCGIRAIGYADNSLNPIYSNSLPAVLTVTAETQPPTLTYAATFENTNQVPSHYVVSVTFSEWMNATTLSNAANYSIAGVTITNVSVESNNRTVRLLVNQPPTLPLNVTVSGVQDLSGNVITPGSTTAINTEKLIFSDVGFPGSDPAYPSFVSVSGLGGYVITAQGSDIWNTFDAFHFAWEWKTNDFDVAVRVVSLGHSHASAKAGVMVRESLDPSSRNWTVANNPAPDFTSSVGANNVEANMRDTFGGATAGWKNLVPGNVPPTYPNAWVRLKRTGNVLASYASSNMVNWVQLGAYDTSTNVNGPLNAEVYVGLCTTAHGNDVIGGPPPPPFLWYNTAEYANYNSSFVPLAPPAQLTITRSGGNVTVSWTPAGGHLEASPAVAGPGVNWQNVGTANPAIVPIGTGPQFFRVVNP
jgi:hypothetical protein